MEQEFHISLYLDSRRAKKSGKFPLKLRVFTPNPRIQKFYPTKYEFTEKEFQGIWLSKKPGMDDKETRLVLQEEEKKVYEIAKKINPFTFTEFEKVLFRGKGEGSNVFWHYGEIVKRKHEEECFGSASSYDLSIKSIKRFLHWQNGNIPEKLLFVEITPSFLKKYESYLIKELGQSSSTVGIYLRALRAVFNEALEEKDIDQEIYPFGKKKYQIPSSRKTKKALNKEQLSTLSKAQPGNIEQEKAKAFWFLSYTCQGVNLKDIAFLRYEKYNEAEGTLRFVREKTKNTTKDSQREIIVPLTEMAKSIISKFGNPNTGAKEFIFPILSDKLSNERKHWEVKNFTKFVNTHMKKLAESVGITGEISPIWARHSYTTSAVQAGASFEMVGDSLGHTDSKTTRNYFAGFENETKKQLLESISDFSLRF